MYSNKNQRGFQAHSSHSTFNFVIETPPTLKGKWLFVKVMIYLAPPGLPHSPFATNFWLFPLAGNIGFVGQSPEGDIVCLFLYMLLVIAIQLLKFIFYWCHVEWNVALNPYLFNRFLEKFSEVSVFDNFDHFAGRMMWRDELFWGNNPIQSLK